MSSGGSSQLRWRSKKEVEKANSKTEGEGNHVPQSLHPGKYRVLRRAQEAMVMVPTPGWKTEQPICFGTVSPEKKQPSLSLEDPFGEVPKQTPCSGVNQLEGHQNHCFHHMRWLGWMSSWTRLGAKRKNCQSLATFI
ncbi:hypothetical protein ACFXTH_001527 [Malus domestica]